MKRILMLCEIDRKYGYDLAPKVHGWLMDSLPNEVANYFHEPKLKPYSLRVLPQKDGRILIEINLLNKYAREAIEAIILNEDLMNFNLGNNQEISVDIISKDIESLSSKELANIFYLEDATNEFQINFLTTTSFKVKGELIFLPDLYFIFQNIMQRYAMVFEDSYVIDKDLLEEIVSKTKIVSFSVQSSYFPIHSRYIPGFIGKIKIRCNGSQTLKNYINMILQFAEYSGVGIKTSMGMGAVKVQNIKRFEKRS